MGKLAKTKVLITGAGGFIASHLCELCLLQEARVRAFVHYNSRNDWGMLENMGEGPLRKIEVYAGDLRDPAAVRRAVKGCDLVFHLGALIGVPYSYVNPQDVVSTNVMGTLHVLQACVEYRVSRLIQTSTSEVYGTARYVPMDEEHPLNPQSPYAASKVASDKLAESYHRTYGLPVVILRPFNAYGPRQSPRAVIPTIITQALRSRSVRLGNLDPKRDLTFVRDVARGFVAAGTREKCEGETIHLGSQNETSVAELIRIIGGCLNKKLQVTVEARRRRPPLSEVERLVASNKKAAKVLGWRPEVPLERGLEQSLDWYRRHGGIFKNRHYNV
jgi:dTDP-glucose 4,6-dehydratase